LNFIVFQDYGFPVVADTDLNLFLRVNHGQRLVRDDAWRFGRHHIGRRDVRAREEAGEAFEVRQLIEVVLTLEPTNVATRKQNVVFAACGDAL